MPAPIRADADPGFLRIALHGVYDLVWFVALVLASPWWLTRCFLNREFGIYSRERLVLTLPRELRPRSGRRRILIHGVSVGEVKAAQSLVKGLVEQDPGIEVVISSTTNTGLGVARQLYPEHVIVRFPLDFSPLVRRFLARVQPDCLVLMELEIWPNFLRQANRFGVPVAVANGRITPGSFGNYKLFRHLLPQFNRISLFCAQDEVYADRFAELAGSRDRVVVTGNIKADGLRVGHAEPPEELVRLLGPRGREAVLVAGSTHADEELWIAQAWREHFPEARLVIAPRHPDRIDGLVRDLAARGVRAQRLTELRRGVEPPDPARPCLVDTMGELEGVYALADLVFVGGSLVPHGGQNMLEPAAQGKAVVYGAHVENFLQEAALLEGSGAARRLAGAEELGPVCGALLRDAEAREAMSRAGIAAVETQKGASRLTLRALSEHCLSQL